MLHDIMAPDRALPWLALAAACGYLAGSIPFGVIVARLFRLGDLRKIGSGNIGATNVLRTGNKLAAALTLVLDALKGTIPVVLFLGWGDLAAQAAGVGAMLGHCFPAWLRFRGGKGVATFLGVILGLSLPAGLMACATWLVAARLSRISSVGALAAAGLAPVWFWLLGRLEAVLTVAALAVLVWLRHHANIRRLIAGEEPRIGARRP
ncbi:glycerol-3-phosphate 1-O-acyltransferase PlsY [Limibaculum sp. M0105]|uniref:Glycerol-3-phosphate acyltransferase n=1 Tax=Thermohalobaculum xanthum TaxID=2753746 RepID=A0A8J7MBP8_9RHOB|nr:glycerol-3-phosphate 1-O-acyltransferase PlsY [Thermohalobaculum xanthum]MBK0401244.1 glycerol-3-phosphate 1-O-acyltransferase PlsY [Thermohalobaculum xanthum]